MPHTVRERVPTPALFSLLSRSAPPLLHAGASVDCDLIPFFLLWWAVLFVTITIWKIHVLRTFPPPTLPTARPRHGFVSLQEGRAYHIVLSPQSPCDLGTPVDTLNR